VLQLAEALAAVAEREAELESQVGPHHPTHLTWGLVHLNLTPDKTLSSRPFTTAPHPLIPHYPVHFFKPSSPYTGPYVATHALRNVMHSILLVTCPFSHPLLVSAPLSTTATCNTSFTCFLIITRTQAEDMQFLMARL
jgi:hypothetical protein